MPRIPMPRASTHRSRSAGASRPATSPVSRRSSLPRWGDLHPNHRIPTFLESIYFEGDASATTTVRYDS